MPQSNQPVGHSYWAHTLGPGSGNYWAQVPNYQAQVPWQLKPVWLELMPCKKRSHYDEKPEPSQQKVAPSSLQLEKATRFQHNQKNKQTKKTPPAKKLKTGALNTQRILWAQGQILKDDPFGCSYPTDLVAQMLKNLPLMWDIQVQSLGWEVPLEKGMARIPWIEEPERPTFSPHWSGGRCKARVLVVRVATGQSVSLAAQRKLGASHWQPRGSWGLLAGSPEEAGGLVCKWFDFWLYFLVFFISLVIWW